MCRFVRDGEPDIGEYRELADGTGICVLADMNGDSEEVVVSLPDGTMPENISDLELLKVPTRAIISHSSISDGNSHHPRQCSCCRSRERR